VTTVWDVGDGLVAHAADGEGQAVLWLHGYTLDTTVFLPLWRRLTGWHHVGLDLPGHGRSRRLRDGDDLRAIADVVSAFAERRSIKHVVALSFGSLLALEIAAARPRQFATLVLAAPGLAGGPHDRAIERRYGELAQLYRRLGCGHHMTELWMRSPPDVFAHVARRPAVAARLASVIDQHSWEEMGGLRMRDLTRHAQDDALLARVRAATLVLIGEHEIGAHVACAEIIARGVRDCAVDRLPDGGHLALLEMPSAAAPRIARHLRRSPSARVR
jgi:pimeloyl-ACP methyl ester carboxylesterase